MVQKDEGACQPGPVIRDLTIPDRDMPLNPSHLGRIRRRVRLPVRLYEAALAAWTLGLALATLGLAEAGWFHPGSGGAPIPALRPKAELVLPPVLPALLPKTDSFRNDARL